VLKVLLNKYRGNNLLTELLFTIFIRVTERGDLVGTCLEVPEAISKGKTLEELRKNMAKAISLIQKSVYKEVATEDGQAIEVTK
jgi:predicted RNase H-like HicB family nuclease